MFIKTDLWTKGQNVILYAGKDQLAIEIARKGNRGIWWPKIAGWFGLEIKDIDVRGY